MLVCPADAGGRGRGCWNACDPCPLHTVPSCEIACDAGCQHSYAAVALSMRQQQHDLASSGGSKGHARETIHLIINTREVHSTHMVRHFPPFPVSVSEEHMDHRNSHFERHFSEWRAEALVMLHPLYGRWKHGLTRGLIEALKA